MDEIPSELRYDMNRIARKLGAVFKRPKWGFTLFVFSFGGGGTMNYISNANRGDMLAALKEFIAKTEREAS